MGILYCNINHIERLKDWRMYIKISSKENPERVEELPFEISFSLIAALL